MLRDTQQMDADNPIHTHTHVNTRIQGATFWQGIVKSSPTVLDKGNEILTGKRYYNTHCTCWGLYLHAQDLRWVGYRQIKINKNYQNFCVLPYMHHLSIE